MGKYDAYIATPDPSSAKDGALLYIPDVISIWQNSKLMADQFAANGYLTLIIDPFNGDPLPLNRPDGFDIFSWLAKGSTGDNPHTKEAVDPIIETAIKYLKEEKGVKKLGAVGYCFGAKVCIYFILFYFISVSIIQLGYLYLSSMLRATSRMAYR